MSKLWLCSDPHLGHTNICKFRTGFSSAEEHHNIVFDNIATSVGKRDTIWFLGDVAFTKEWLAKIQSLHCIRKVLVIGNHDNKGGIHAKELAEVYDDITGLVSHKNIWVSHCPIHLDEMRTRLGNIHGHTHNHIIPDERYLNICVEHTNFGPITWDEAREKLFFQLDQAIPF